MLKFVLSIQAIYMITREETGNSFSSKLISWYEENKRDLPWRGITDTYKIWLSEIILQQTRVVQGMDYFLRITGRFPDVKSLAEADEDEVLKYWQGLGYYSRARNLHHAARTVMSDFGGKMPVKYSELLKLKGIGEYTAAAISSFAGNDPHPVVDGNVFRFLSRYLGIAEPIDTGKGKKLFTETAGKLMDRSRAGQFNQAIMEFGALQCIPGIPDCKICPFSDSCVAFSENKQAAYPVKQNKVSVKNRYFHYFHIIIGSRTLIYKRDRKDIWQNLYEFPMIETTEAMTFEELKQTSKFQKFFGQEEALRFRIRKNKKHVLTHRIIWAVFYDVHLEKVPESLKSYQLIEEKDIDSYAIHRLMEEYLEDAAGS